MATFSDLIPLLWQQRDAVRPLFARYGARVLGRALARQYGLRDSRTACHRLAAFIMALTDFREEYDYSDFYVSLGTDDPAVGQCIRELQALRLVRTSTDSLV